MDQENGGAEEVKIFSAEKKEALSRAEDIFQRLSGLSYLIEACGKTKQPHLLARIEQRQQEITKKLIEFNGGLNEVDQVLSAGGHQAISAIEDLDLSWLPEDLRYKKE